jgi:serine/threonine protein kinase
MPGLVAFSSAYPGKNSDTCSSTGEASQMPTETETSPGAVLGTVGYMSPEQASGGPWDFSSDQFSLGAILYEVTTGKRAFQKGNLIDTLSAILHENPRPPRPGKGNPRPCFAKRSRRETGALTGRESSSPPERGGRDCAFTCCRRPEGRPARFHRRRPPSGISATRSLPTGASFWGFRWLGN